ncbi:type III pantothenate kinase [Pleionea mediterranea]|uniref:Type III pantothenate kinase n=1 Tax=Pleionea mediterranea TaxID=523701 RepID=A0A316G0H8_9GAMM|nr:type III pantothenate kinase [Pleionea mediterranea]PWK54162.1 type III pantothenate kinase [Pleionea mediterranea]
MNLLLDVGNSRIKCAISNESDNLVPLNVSINHRDGFNAENCWLNIRQCLEVNQLGLPSIIGISCVRPSVTEALVDSAKCYFEAELHIAKTQKYHKQLINSYAVPDTMGVDRWLAMLAATRGGEQAAMVIDCGTAMTIDLVASGGQHLGGYIVAGLENQLSALLSNTERVFAGDNLTDTLVTPGQNTQACVLNGLYAQAIAFIEQQIQFALSQGITETWFTGGNAQKLIQPIKMRSLYPEMALNHNDLLIFEGLLTSLQEDRKKI